MKLSKDISTVKLEIDLPVLFSIFQLLVENEQKDYVRRFLIQLKNEEYINEEDLNELANHYQLGSPLFW
jgi:hypothetical protein